jgi:hypothetical protein
MFLCLSGCLAALATACSGTSVAAPSALSPPPASVTAATASGSPAGTVPAGRTQLSVVTSYYRAIEARNYRQAFGYLARNATGPDGRLTLTSFLQLARTLDNMGGRVTSFSVGIHLGQVVMTNERTKVFRYHAHLQLARTGTTWLITSIDRI